MTVSGEPSMRTTSAREGKNRKGLDDIDAGRSVDGDDAFKASPERLF